jgi:hypothetical protein
VAGSGTVGVNTSDPFPSDDAMKVESGKLVLVYMKRKKFGDAVEAKVIAIKKS